MVSRRNREPTMVHTWLSCSARAGIAVNDRDPLWDYTDVISFVDTLSEWSWHFVSRCRDVLSKSIFNIMSDCILWIGINYQLGSYMLLHPWRSSFESRDEIPLRGEGCDTPGVYFVLWREIYPNLGCSVKFSISLSHLSSYSWMFHQIWNLFDLKNGSLLKLLFLEANANSKVSLVSHLPSRLIYSDSGQLWCYLIYVRIRFLDNRSTSKYLIQIRILPQDLFVSTSN
jgi:hypothetical protein